MLKPRLIPSLLVDSNQHLVKTTSFKERHYIGEPLNSAYIFSGFQADELLVLDIDASLEKRTISFDFVKALSSFTSVPLTVGGGISDLSQIKKLLSFGVEKTVISSKISEDFQFLEKAANKFGSSSITVIVNVIYDVNTKEYYGYFGRKGKGMARTINSLIKDIQNAGAGELIINNIDLEGSRKGFDIPLIKRLNEILLIPLVALGGCGSTKHIEDLLKSTPVNGVGCGSFFVYANKKKEILLNYAPTAKWLQNNFEELLGKWEK